MKKAFLTIGVVAAQLLAVNAFSQDGGKPPPIPPVKSVSPVEKAEAQADRKVEGAAAARNSRPGETGAVKPPMPAMSTPPAEKAAARAKREAEGTEAVRTNPGGEVGKTK